MFQANKCWTGLVCSENHNSTKWKSSLLWYFVSDLGLEINGQITLPKVLYRTARQLPAKTAILQKREGKYETTPYSQLLHRSECFAAALIELQFQAGDRVAIWLKNSLEWAVSDFGTMDAGGATAPLYLTLNPSAVEDILRDSGASFVIVENEEKLKTIGEIWERLPKLRFVVVKDAPADSFHDERILSFEKFLEIGENALPFHGEEISRRRETASYDDLATLIYTSGTTGSPKGVMLTHRNILSNVLGLLSVSEVNENDVALSILPLAHAFERTVGYYLFLLTGATIAYAESFETILKNMQEVRPTICAAVPRIFERMYERTQKKIEDGSVWKRRLFQWGLNVGRQVVAAKERALSLKHPDRRIRHRPEDRNNHTDPEIPGFGLRLRWALAKRLLHRKFNKALGGRLKYFVSGGAPLNPEVCRFFMNLGINIYEGYGLTETSPIIAFNYRNKLHPGTVGKLLPWVQIKFGPEAEICVKGPNLMAGHFRNLEATAEVIDKDGWLQTGDIGYLDENNFLHITDRKKELIVMSNGKKVAPLPIEGMLSASPFVGQVVILGNNQKFLSTLIVPNFTRLEEYAASQGVRAPNHPQLLRTPKVKELFDRLVSEVNLGLSPFEQIKRFKLLTHEFSQEGGEITPTLKVRRKIIEMKYSYLVDELYG